MASFEEILKRPAKEVRPPPAFPVGTYHCLVDGPPEPGTSASQKNFLRFKFKIISSMEDVDARAAAEAQVVGKTVTSDQWLTDAASYRLVDFLRDDLGIEEGDKSIEEMIFEAPGKQVLVTLRHEPSQDGKRVYHRVDRTAHV